MVLMLNQLRSKISSTVLFSGQCLIKSFNLGPFQIFCLVKIANFSERQS